MAGESVVRGWCEARKRRTRPPQRSSGDARPYHASQVANQSTSSGNPLAAVSAKPPYLGRIGCARGVRSEKKGNAPTAAVARGRATLPDCARRSRSEKKEIAPTAAVTRGRATLPCFASRQPVAILSQSIGGGFGETALGRIGFARMVRSAMNEYAPTAAVARGADLGWENARGANGWKRTVKSKLHGPRRGMADLA